MRDQQFDLDAGWHVVLGYGEGMLVLPPMHYRGAVALRARYDLRLGRAYLRLIKI